MNTYVVPATELPTGWNKSAAVGAIGGTFIGGPIGAAVGAIFGGMYGKNIMEKEAETGHVVHEPTAWNKDAIIGGFFGNLAGSVVALGIGVAAISIATPAAVVIGTALMSAAVIGGTVIGAMRGAARGKEYMQNEYTEAQALALEGKAKVIGVVDIARQQSTPVLEKATSSTVEAAPQELPSNHAARIREQQAQQQTAGRGV